MAKRHKTYDDNLLSNIPYEDFDGDVKDCRMTSAEVHALANKLLKEEFARIRLQ
jgi:hypothetical protein